MSTSPDSGAPAPAPIAPAEPPAATRPAISSTRSQQDASSSSSSSLSTTVAAHLPHLSDAQKAELQTLKDDIVDVARKADAAVTAPPTNAPPASGLAAQLRSLAAGGFGGVCAVVVGHPFDLVKVRLQTAEKGVYSSALDVVRKSVAKDGLRRGLYAGVSAPLVGVTPMFAVSFWGYDLGKTLVRSVSAPNPDGSLTIGQISAAGFFSAIPMTAITAPFERVKVILQVQGQKVLAPGEKPKYNGAIDVVRHLYREGGVRSVFRGSAATLARDGPGSAAYFAAYEYIKHALTPKDPTTGKPADGGKLSLTAITVAGAAAGVAMWIPVFPVDTVKSRLQTSTAPGITVGSVVRELYGRGGLRAFFPGIGPALARAVPANAATFLGVELAHQAMNKAFN
ncbi:Mitochondrial carrier domain protein [Niveomyces insectorum RCEF 264]|uniref:Mitochondrial carrier domain protein n=1 Tax=Niveomyces insectorum RCEF 264 TaxID=1081102 RepID=A0A162MT57_9HYPO|nr:Mitochondrial carrier domain protein [Niveomyces insectorum RCEF 264]